jgi:hypothetical protein
VKVITGGSEFDVAETINFEPDSVLTLTDQIVIEEEPEQSVATPGVFAWTGAVHDHVDLEALASRCGPQLRPNTAVVRFEPNDTAGGDVQRACSDERRDPLIRVGCDPVSMNFPVPKCVTQKSLLLLDREIGPNHRRGYAQLGDHVAPVAPTGQVLVDSLTNKSHQLARSACGTFLEDAHAAFGGGQSAVPFPVRERKQTVS